MAYTPTISRRSSASVRRLAWAIRQPMTKTMDQAINLLAIIIPPELVCPQCKDTSACNQCVFSSSILPDEKEQLLSALCK
jgi:hypothetical protein